MKKVCYSYTYMLVFQTGSFNANSLNSSFQSTDVANKVFNVGISCTPSLGMNFKLRAFTPMFQDNTVDPSYHLRFAQDSNVSLELKQQLDNTKDELRRALRDKDEALQRADQVS